MKTKRNPLQGFWQEISFEDKQPLPLWDNPCLWYYLFPTTSSYCVKTITVLLYVTLKAR